MSAVSSVNPSCAESSWNCVLAIKSACSQAYNGVAVRAQYAYDRTFTDRTKSLLASSIYHFAVAYFVTEQAATTKKVINPLEWGWDATIHTINGVDFLLEASVDENSSKLHKSIVKTATDVTLWLNQKRSQTIPITMALRMNSIPDPIDAVDYANHAQAIATINKFRYVEKQGKKPE